MGATEQQPETWRAILLLALFLLFNVHSPETIWIGKLFKQMLKQFYPALRNREIIPPPIVVRAHNKV